MGNFTAEKQNDCTVITIPFSRRKDWEAQGLIISDVHCDNKGFQKNKFKRDMDAALEKGAFIIDNGDFFDCMGGKWDKRSNKADVLPEFQTGNYFDSILKYGIELLNPYKENIVIMSDGNHEISVRERHETDLTERLIQGLGGSIIHQKYTGWIVFRFLEESAKSTPTSSTLTMYRTHGSGGNAPVTKGVIQSARRQDHIDADLYVSGHIHTEYSLPRPKWYLDRNGNVKIKTPLHQQIGTYKDSTMKTWEDMKGFSPPSLGGCWIVFNYDSETERVVARFQTCR